MVKDLKITHYDLRSFTSQDYLESVYKFSLFVIPAKLVLDLIGERVSRLVPAKAGNDTKKDGFPFARE